MNAIIKCAVALTGILALAGCAGMEYDDAEMSSASGSGYQRDLHDEYVKLSKSEFDQGDYADSDKYAEKDLALSNGEHVQPELIATRQQPADKVGAIRLARVQLGEAACRGRGGEYV